MHANTTNRARALRRNSTEAERHLWYYLRGGRMGGWKFRRQCPIGPWVVDLACLRARLVIELDGGQHAERAAADAARTRDLDQRGYLVLRFWNDAVLTETERVLEAIQQALDAARGA